MTTQQYKMICLTSKHHETKVWVNMLGGNIRLCVFNKNKQEFSFLTIRPNGESNCKEFEKLPVDEKLMSIWKQLPKVMI